MGKRKSLKNIILLENPAYIKTFSVGIKLVDYPIDFEYTTWISSAKEKAEKDLKKKAKKEGADIVFIKKQNPHNGPKFYAGTAIFYKFIKRSYNLERKI